MSQHAQAIRQGVVAKPQPAIFALNVQPTFKLIFLFKGQHTLLLLPVLVLLLVDLSLLPGQPLLLPKIFILFFKYGLLARNLPVHMQERS